MPDPQRLLPPARAEGSAQRLLAIRQNLRAGDGLQGAVVCAVAALVLPLLVLIGEPLLGPLPVSRLRHGFAAMVPTTALFLVLTALSILALALKRPRTAQLAATAVLAFALLRLSQSVAGTVAETGPMDRVGTGTALGLGLVALALLATPYASRRAGIVVHVAASGGLLTATIVLTGYAFDASNLSSSIILSGVSVPTAMTLFLLATGTLILNAQRTWLRYLIGTSRSARRGQALLLGAILTAFALVAVLLFVDQRKYMTTRLSHALLADLLVVLAVLVVVLMARARRLEEARLRLDLTWLTNVLDATEAAALVLDAEGQVLLSNQKARDLAGPRTDPATWLRDTPFFTLGSMALLTGARHPRALVGGPGHEGGLRAAAVAEDGGIRSYVFHGHPIDDVALTGQRITIITVLDDTANWRAREARARVERLETVGLMAGGAAHEFSNILGVIRLTADVGALRGAEADRPHFEAIGRACERGESLTARLLSLARDSRAEPEPCDLAVVLAELPGLLSPLMAPGIELDVWPGTVPVPSLVERGELEAAILNLTLNAVHAISARPEARGRIGVHLAAHGDWAEITVLDDGIGMSEATARHATTPFFTTREEAGGSGLGLSMVDAFASQSGGELAIDSVLGVGTRITLRLPLLPNLPVAAPDAPPAGAEGAPGEALLAGLSLLVVDSDEPRSLVLPRALGLLGARVARANRGDEALAMLRSQPFDLVLTHNPIDGPMDGVALTRAIAEEQPGMAMLLLTGIEQSRQELPVTDGVLVLRRPVPVRRLANAILLALARRDQEPR